MAEELKPLQVLLEEGASFEGEMRFQGTARLSGAFTGRIYGEEGSTLIIESTALVSGSAAVDHLILQGRFDGELKAKKSVLIEPSSRFKGEVEAPSLSVKEGARFEGISRKPGALSD